MNLDRDFFFKEVRKSPFKKLSQSQVDGLNWLLDVWERHYAKYDRRWLAYLLATAFHETAHTMLPIEEYGKGKGRAYGPTGFWGRGYVQLTWERNYQHASAQLRKIGIDVDLVRRPELACEPEIGAHVLFLGSIEGWFTGKTLGDYFSDRVNDPVNARRVINGTDKASQIADYHKAFLSAMRDAPEDASEPVHPASTPLESLIIRLIRRIFGL